MIDRTDEQDRGLAQAHLRRLQEAAFAHGAVDPFENGMSAPEFDELRRRIFSTDSYDGNYEEFVRSVQHSENDARRGRATDLEGVGWYAIVSSMMARLQHEMASTRLVLSHPIVLGTMPTGSVNGMSIALKAVRTKIVVLNHGLLMFCHLVSKAVSLAFPIRPDTFSDGYSLSFCREAIAARLSETREPAIRLGDVLVSYVVNGAAHRARTHRPSIDVGNLAWTLCESIELFVIGHELGHVARDHHDGERVKREVAPGVVADVVSTSWNNEYEADFVGLFLMLRAMDRAEEPMALAASGAHLFLRAMEAVEDTVSILATGKRSTTRSDATHPPLRDRRRYLESSLLALVPDEQDRAGVPEVTSAFMFAFDAIFDQLEPALLELHENGARPMPSFRAAKR